MCGINGIIGPELLNEEIIKIMNEITGRRGPDSNDFYKFENTHIRFGHNRLSIIDTSTNSNQPRYNKDNGYILTYNGEIYNYHKLSSEKQHTSDTIALESLIKDQGFLRAISKIEGMFAIGFADIHKRKIYLARDYFGQKPLYYWQSTNNGWLIFSSDIDAIKAALDNLNISLDIDLCASAQYFNYNYIGGDCSIYKNIKKVLPGEILEFNLELRDKPISHWLYRDAFFNKCNRRTQARQPFENLFETVIKDYLYADVPMGCFLSGGIDSTAIASAYTRVTSGSIKTFTVNFDDEFYSEGAVAARTADEIKSDHYEVRINENDLQEFANNLSTVFSEPFSDSSQIATYFVSKLAASEVKAVLTGDGGDEVFGGYNRYKIVSRLNMFSNNKILNTSVQTALPLIQKLFTSTKVLSYLNAKQQLPLGDINAKLDKLAEFLKTKDQLEFHNNVTKRNIHEIEYFRDDLLNAAKKFYSTNKNYPYFAPQNKWIDLRNIDLHEYLPGDNMQKVDRCSMYHGLECRAPLLDSRLLNYANNCSLTELIYKNKTKLPLRKYVYNTLKSYKQSNHKSGFSVPMRSFIFPALIDWIRDVVMYGPNDAVNNSLLNRQNLIKKIEHFMLTGKGDPLALWDAIVFSNFENKFWLEYD